MRSASIHSAEMPQANRLENNMSRKLIVPFMTFFLILSCAQKSEGLKQSDVQGLVYQFLAMHAQHHSLTDEISERTLENYLMILDYGKYYFLKSDIETFRKKKHLIDDYLKARQYDFIFEIYMVYRKRVDEKMLLFDRMIVNNYDFNVDEKIILDRDKVDFSSTPEETKNRWRKTIKLQLLNYMSAGKKIDYAKKKLIKKYELLHKEIKKTSTEDILAKFVNAYSTALDPHSNYLTQDQHEDFKISMELKLEGIGVRLRSEDGFVIVESIIPGGATDKLPDTIKLKPNDKIVAVAQADGEPVDVIDMHLRDVVKKIRGKKGTEVRLTILRETETNGGDKPSRMIVPIVREEIKLQDSDAESDTKRVKINGKSVHIGYIKLPSFYQDTQGGKSSAGDMVEHLLRMNKKKVSGLILDLRGNPGGLLNEAIDIAGLFIDKGPVVQIKDGRNPPRVYSDHQGGALYDGPLVILIDKFSASASEILAGAFKDYQRGLVIGPSNTFGKGTVQQYNALPFRGGAIKVTTHIFYQPGGTSNQLHGIKPDIFVPAMSSIWDIGESKTRYPLQWKQIQRASFTPWKKISPSVMAKLKRRSQGRIKGDKKFIKLIAKIKKYKKQLNNKSISLKEESIIEKQKKKELEKNERNKKNKKIIDLEQDIFLKEAMNITSDYIIMSPKR